jgi:type III restriction enzyme
MFPSALLPPAMHRQVNAITGRLSLRAPQRESLELLDQLMSVFPPPKEAKDANAVDLLAVLRQEFPTLTDFERGFPSVGFSLATGVGKTRLMGAFIAYLHLAHGIQNFFVLAPNLTIYDKLIQDFTPNTPKYVFRGIAEFATHPPAVITGENYTEVVGNLFYETQGCKINVFNISKINSEVRGGKAPRIKQLGEYLGESYFAYLAKLPDLVLLMDESHRYRASAGVRAINELRPILGLELTATPYVETNKGPVEFKNLIFDYRLAQAMEDGFVKEPAVATRKDFDASGMSAEELEKLKLEDGIRLHEQVKVELETYARQSGLPVVKPFVLVIARDTSHAAQLLETVQTLFGGSYRGKAIQVDSSTKEEEVIERLLKVEQADEPTEIVIHVNMLKEGWDVTNLYTIVPLRAANARVLIEQSIGRGLRLPYGKRTGVEAVDRLTIVAHDRFQEIVDEARRPGSVLRLKTRYLDPTDLSQPTKTVVSQSGLATQLGLTSVSGPGQATIAEQAETPLAFAKPDEQALAQLAYAEIRKLANQPTTAPTRASLTNAAVQAAIVQAVEARRPPVQLALGLNHTTEQPDVAAIVARTIELVQQQTIDIPRIMVAPIGEVQSGFHYFTLNLSNMNYQDVADDIWIQNLGNGKSTVVTLGRDGEEESRLEDYVVMELIDYNDVNYDDHADQLYDLASQVVQHFLQTRHKSEEQTRRILRTYQKAIAEAVHSQMQPHAWDKSTGGYEVVVSQGFTELKSTAYTTTANEPVMDYRLSPADKSNMARYVFGGFQRCLYPVQKFDSDTERIISIILDRDAVKWFRPAKGQFQLFYKQDGEMPEYQPDFVAETSDAIYMLEPKRRSEMEDVIVLAKKAAAEAWCANATAYNLDNGGKPWVYALIPHDVVAESRTLKGLVKDFGHSVALKK